MRRSLTLATLFMLLLAGAPSGAADRVHAGTSDFRVFVDWTPYVDSRDPTCVAGNDLDASTGPLCSAPAPLLTGVRVGGRNYRGVQVYSVTIHWDQTNEDTYYSHPNGLQTCFSGTQDGCDFPHFYDPRLGYTHVWVEVRAENIYVSTASQPIGVCFIALARCSG